MTKEEVLAVKHIGDAIGYGNMMAIASSLWRKSLKENGYPQSGAFVTTCLGQFDKEGERVAEKTLKMYDAWIEKLL